MVQIYCIDMFFVWASTEEEFIFSFLNGCNPDLKFSVEYDAKRVHFLDMWIQFNDDNVTLLCIKKRQICTIWLVHASLRVGPT